jgi:hypothetical protein
MHAIDVVVVFTYGANVLARAAGVVDTAIE